MEAAGQASFDLKADKSVVTKFDRQLELETKDVLRPLSSEVGFLGEEHGPEGSKEIYWTVDPIDGTESFIRGYPAARNQLALVVNGVIEYALVYQFQVDALYIARRGHGATKNGQKLAREYRPLERCWIDVSLKIREKSQAKMLLNLVEEIYDYAYAHNYLSTVDGYFDGMVNGFGGGPWDYYPRALLCQEAGLKVGNIGSDKFDLKINNLVAAHPDNFDRIQALLSSQA